MAAISAYDVGKKAQYIKIIGKKFPFRIQPPSAILNFFRFLKIKKSQNSDFLFFKKIRNIKIMSYLDSSYFSDNNGHIICSISIYRLKDMNYAILNELMSKK